MTTIDPEPEPAGCAHCPRPADIHLEDAALCWPCFSAMVFGIVRHTPELVVT